MNAPKKDFSGIMRENKAVFIIIAVVLFLVELEIFAIAAMKSGKKSWLQILDQEGNVIHETDGKSLSDFNKYYFEKTFGPFENYKVKLVTQENPFPFRAWFVAAVGIPLGIILLFAFIVKAYSSLVYGDEEKHPLSISSDSHKTNFEKIIAGVSNFNIFIIGFLVLLAVLLYWIVPNFVIYIGKTGAETFERYKWIFLSIGIVGVGIFIWIVYLKYLLAKKTIDSQVELAKYRLQLEMSRPAHQQLIYTTDHPTDNPSLTWKEPSKEQIGIAETLEK